ncbi:MAG TPA: serine/threonine-protein kinase [Byssovorax sp.]
MCVDTADAARFTAEVADLKPGTRIADRYIIAERIGEGGMGVVYSARDDKLRRSVAVKMIAHERAGSSTARKRLAREARAAAALDNPGIAQVFDVGETDDGGAFLVMELVRGQSVRVLGSKMLRPEIVRVIREVARTLGAAHKESLVHRDVKPDNIMVRDDGRVVLLDFGIAKEVRHRATDGESEPDSVITAKGAVLGTPPYIAPEQIRGKDVSPASDQFALAVVAFQLLTGKKPWDAPSDLGILGQILTAPPLRLSDVASWLPASLDEVFERAMAKDPAHRFDSVEAFADALEEKLEPKVAVEAPPKVLSVPPPAAAPLLAEPTPAEVEASEARGRLRWVAVAVALAVAAVAIWFTLQR